MTHSPMMTEGQLAARCHDHSEHDLNEWLDDDERILTIYYTGRDLSNGDGRWFMDTLHIIGAAATGDDGPTEVFDRDGLAALIGARFVDRLEQSREEYWA